MNDESYILDEQDLAIIAATKTLLWRIVKQTSIDAKQLTAASKLIEVFENMPLARLDVTEAARVRGPTRRFGENEIWHYWHIEVERGEIRINSGGHFYRPSTGGDSFSSMSWVISPGCSSEFLDYLEHLSIVNDAAPYPDEVGDIEFSKPGYAIEIDERTVEDDLASDRPETDSRVEEMPVEPSDKSEELLDKFVVNNPSNDTEREAQDPPDQCAFCKADVAHRKYYVDGKLKGNAMWANMCSRCFHAKGEGIGWGRGQLYQRQRNGDWIMVAGGPPND